MIKWTVNTMKEIKEIQVAENRLMLLMKRLMNLWQNGTVLWMLLEIYNVSLCNTLIFI